MVCSMKGDNKELTLRKGSVEISFYVFIPTDKGSLYYMHFNKSGEAEMWQPGTIGLKMGKIGCLPIRCTKCWGI